MYDNGVRIGKNFYIGCAQIFTPDGVFPEEVPPIVADAIECKGNYSVKYMVSGTERLEIYKKTVFTQPSRTTIQILDKIVPVIKPWGLSGYYGKYSEWDITYDQTTKLITMKKGKIEIKWQLGTSQRLVEEAIDKARELDTGSFHYSIMVDYLVENEKYEPKEIVKYRPHPRPKKVLKPIEWKGKLIGITDRYGLKMYGHREELWFDGKMIHVAQYLWDKRVKEVYRWTGWEYPLILDAGGGNSPVIVEKLNGPNKVAGVRMYESQKYYVFEDTFDVRGAVSKDGRIIITRLPPFMDWQKVDEYASKLMEKYFGEEQKYIQYVQIDQQIINFEYKSDKKEYYTEVLVDKEGVVVEGYVPDFSGWKNVTGKALREVVGATRIKNARKRFSVGRIPVKLVRKIESDDGDKITFHFDDVKLTVNRWGEYILRTFSDEIIRRGSIKDESYGFVLMMIENNKGELSALL